MDRNKLPDLSGLRRLVAGISDQLDLMPLLPELTETMNIAAMKRGNPRRPNRSQFMGDGQ